VRGRGPGRGCLLQLVEHWHTGRAFHGAFKVDFKLRPCVFAFNPAQRRRCVIRGALGPMTVTVVNPAAELPGRL
jgi:hypothetical protein